VALTPDGSGGAFLAVANEAVDDALGIDVSAASMLVHMDSDGTTTWLATGVRTDQDVCPRLRQPAPLSRSDLLFGRISDLVIRGDRLWLGDAGCRRILAVQLNGA
jgi:hypothetical protein